MIVPRIKNIPISQLVEPETNPNRMSDEHFFLLKQNMEERGFLQPLLVREPLPGEMDPASETVARLGNGVDFYRIIDGVHRFRAAKEIGALDSDELPCVVLDGNTGNDVAMALQIGMNRLRGELDLASVAKVLALLTTDFNWAPEDLHLTGMTAEEADDLLKTVRPASAEDVLRDAELGGGNDAPPPDPEEGKFPLEIVFTSAADRKRAQKALKKAAGKGGSLALGLLRLADGETT